MVTAFNIEAYKLLKEDPPERSAQILQQISLQLSSFSVNPTFANSSEPPFRDTAFKATSLNIVINTLFFLSLALALLAALFAILAQGWIRQYNDFPLVSGSERARMRQTRFTHLTKWFVPQIIMSLAVFLQAALLAFFVGLLLFLWGINNVVAIVITCTVAAFLAICLVMATIPTFDPTCPYKSPLAWAINAYGCILLYIPVAFLTWMLTPHGHTMDPNAPVSAGTSIATSERGGLRHFRWLNRALPMMRSRSTINLHDQLSIISTRLAVMEWLRRPLPFLRSWKARIMCRNWLALERRHQARTSNTDAARVLQAIQVIDWTTKTSSVRKADYLAPCLLDSLEPKEVLLHWINHSIKRPNSTEVAIESLEVALTVFDNHLADHPHAPPHQLDMATVLILHTCHRNLETSHDPSSTSTVVHLLTWLTHRHAKPFNDLHWAQLNQLVPLLDPARAPVQVVAFLELVLWQYLNQPKVANATGMLFSQRNGCPSN